MPEMPDRKSRDQKVLPEVWAKFFKSCPKCGSETTPEDEFCGECGYQLAKPIEPPPIDYSNPPILHPEDLGR